MHPLATFLILASLCPVCVGWRAPIARPNPTPTKAKSLPKFIGTILTSASLLGIGGPVFADSPLNAPSASGTRVNSDADSLLRSGLPISNKDIRSIQASVETAKINIKTRRIQFAKQDVQKAKGQLTQNKDKLLKAVPGPHKEAAAASIARMEEDFAPLLAALDEEQASGAGSLQERKGLQNFSFVLFALILSACFIRDPQSILFGAVRCGVGGGVVCLYKRYN